MDSLRAFPSLDQDSIIDGLKSELPQYMAKAEDVALTIFRTDWWSHHENELPNWSKACKMSLLFQPSSAAAERVLYFRIHLINNNTLHWKIILRHLLCYSTITGHNFVIFYC